MTQVVMLGQTIRPLPYLAPTTPGFTPRPDETQEAFIGTYCRDNARRSTDRCARAWDRLRALYCTEHAVDGWTVARAKHNLEKALTTTRLGPDGRKHKDVPSEATVRRYWKHLVEAGLIAPDTRIGLVSAYTERVFLPGVLEAHGGIEAHADRLARRRASDRERQRRRAHGSQPPAELAGIPSLATSSALDRAEYSQAKATYRPILAPRPSLVTDSRQHKATPRPTSYGPSAPPTPPKAAFPFPPQSHIVPNPSETEERRRTEVESTEARLPLAPKTQLEDSNPALSHDSPVQPLALLRREAPPRPEPAVADPNPQAFARPANTPKPTGYDGVRDDKYKNQIHLKASDKPPVDQPDALMPTDPDALNAWLDARRLPRIPPGKPKKSSPDPRITQLLAGFGVTMSEDPGPDSDYVDPAERDTRRPWDSLNTAYDALCELKFREATEAQAKEALHPMAFAAVVGVRPWPQWVDGPGPDVDLGWVQTAFERYRKQVNAGRADLRLPTGPPRDPVGMVRFLEAVTCPRANAYAFDGRSMVKLRLGSVALLSAIDQADAAFQRGQVGGGKAYARYLQGIATRLADERTTR